MDAGSFWMGWSIRMGSSVHSSQASSGSSRTSETGPGLPPPMGGGRARTLADSGWPGPLGQSPPPVCVVTRPQEAPSRATHFFWGGEHALSLGLGVLDLARMPGHLVQGTFLFLPFQS